MALSSSFIHSFAVALTTALTGLGVSIGQGITAKAAFDAINRQPTSSGDITRATLLSLAITETGAILGLLVSFLLFFQPVTELPGALAQVAMAIATALPGLIIGIASAMPAQEALISIARQPFLGRRITNFMLLTQSLIQTPMIFGFIIALIIRNRVLSVTTVGQALLLIGSAVAIGIGCIGPAAGVGYFTKIACRSTGINRMAYSRLFTFTFISQAIIETPVIFAAIISFFLINKAGGPMPSTLIGFAHIMFALTMGLGTFGPGISSGRSAAAACEQIALTPQAYTMLARSSMMAQGIIDTCAVYAFIISLWLILLPF
jgi:F-type H+-transporting ATPase subunit c